MAETYFGYFADPFAPLVENIELLQQAGELERLRAKAEVCHLRAELDVVRGQLDAARLSLRLYRSERGD